MALAGHYVALVKNGDKWLLFEDESVELVNEGVVQSVFGSSQVRESPALRQRLRQGRCCAMRLRGSERVRPEVSSEDRHCPLCVKRAMLADPVCSVAVGRERCCRRLVPLCVAIRCLSLTITFGMYALAHLEPECSVGLGAQQLSCGLDAQSHL